MPFKSFTVGEAERSFWKTVRRYRIAREISQNDLAPIIVIDKSNISRSEKHGGRIPSREIVLKMIEIFGLDLIQREEFLALAGYSFTSDFFEATLELLEKGRGQSHYGIFTHTQLELCLKRCIAALLFHHKPSIVTP